MAETFYLIDGHSNAYRAYFAMERSRSRLTSPTGQPTGAIYNFVSMLEKLIKQKKPSYIAAAFDAKGPTFRHERYPDYKATRKPMPDSLRSQLPTIIEVVRAYGVPVFSIEGFEADDVLATLARRAAKRGIDVYIVTADRDLYQLVDGEHIYVYDERKDTVFTPDEVKASLGVLPEKVLDLKGLAGDSSDNLPGVRGIGPKTAVQLLEKYGSLDEVLANAGNEKGKRKERLIAHADDARLSRELATICDDVELDLDFEQCRVGGGDMEKLSGMFKDLGFQGFMDVAAEVADEVPSEGYATVTSAAALKKLAASLREAGRFAFDLETTSLSPIGAEIVGLSVAAEAGRASYVPVRAPSGVKRLSEQEVLDEFRPLLEDPKITKIGQNLKYDTLVLRGAGIEAAGFDFDTMVAAYLLQPGARSYGIDALALERLGLKKISTREVIGKGKDALRMDEAPVDIVSRYASEDADVTWQLYESVGPELGEHGLEDLFREIEMPLVHVLAELEWNGVKVDPSMLEAMSEELDKMLELSEQEIYEAAGQEFNIASPKQLRTILFDELKLPVLRRTKTGPSTDMDVLRGLSSRHPLPKLILEHRSLAKLKGTYVDPLPQMINERTGRIHASFNQTVTATGRLSSSDPNLQNIPVRTEIGRSIRSCFVAEPGCKLLSADYSQIELRILAHYSEDPGLVRAFREGADIHRAVAAEVGHGGEAVPLDEVTPEMRRQAKAVNFGIIYGQGAAGLAADLGIERGDAQRFIDRYFERFSAVQGCWESIIAGAREDGYVRTILGRIRYLPEIKDESPATRNFAERAAVNTVFQGSGADLIKKAMVDTQSEIENRGMKSKMILQVHDELVFEAPEAEVDELRERVVSLMEGAMTLGVPLKVDTGVGDNWLEVK